MLRCIVGAGEKPIEEGIAEERRAVLATMGTPDQREGMMAFLGQLPVLLRSVSCDTLLLP